MITLYHGSNVEVETIDLAFSKKGKDFGCGFYLNPNREQALAMAKRVTKTRQSGEPTISEFVFDETILTKSENLNIKIFKDYSSEWAQFILSNRSNASDTPAHPYDIVVGPIADDTVGVQLRRYMMNYISVEVLIEELKYHANHAVQYYFGTQRAIELLTKIR